MVTLYSTGPGCFRCATVKRHLKHRGIPFEEVRVDENPQKAECLRQKGFSEVPVVKAHHNGETVWSQGYRPDFLDGLAHG